jgi:hypothetical protein
MVKNVKRYQKQIKREGGSLAAQESADIIPATFVLPQVSGNRSLAHKKKSLLNMFCMSLHTLTIARPAKDKKTV